MMANLACPWCNTHNIVVAVGENKINAHTCWKCGMTFDYKRNSENGYATIRHGIDTSIYMSLYDDNPFKKQESTFGMYLSSMIKVSLPGIKKIIENNPATVILWEDGTKTMAKCQDGDVFDFEKGVLICSLKKLIGNKATNELLKEIEKQPVYHDGYTGGMRGKEFRKCLKQEEVPKLCQTCKYLEKTTQEDPCYICLKRYWKDGLHHNWEPRK